MSQKHEFDPPPQVKLWWCPVCGRNDRHSPFTGKSHYSYSGRCPGKLEEAVYELRRAS